MERSELIKNDDDDNDDDNMKILLTHCRKSALNLFCIGKINLQSQSDCKGSPEGTSGTPLM